MKKLPLYLGLLLIGGSLIATLYSLRESLGLIAVVIAIVAPISLFGYWVKKNWKTRQVMRMRAKFRRLFRRNRTPNTDAASGNMSALAGYTWMVAILALGTFFLVIFPYLFIQQFFPITAVVISQITGAIWVLWLAVEGVRIVKKPNFWVVERFGQLWVVKKAGIRFFLLLGLVDRVKTKNTFALQRFKLYEGDKEAEIDFADGASAPVRGDCWFKITKPERWAYAYQDGEAEQRVQQIVDGFIRPNLQGLTISEARTEQTAEGKHLSQMLKDDGGVKSALAEIGVELDPEKPFILSDIIISQAIQDALKEKLIAEITADTDRLRASGVKDAIEDILKSARALRGKISYTEAVKIFTDRTALETLEKMASKGNANFSFVTPDMGGVTKTFEVGATQRS